MEAAELLPDQAAAIQQPDKLSKLNSHDEITKDTGLLSLKLRQLGLEAQKLLASSGLHPPLLELFLQV